MLSVFAGVVERAGYGLLQSPLIEDAHLYQASPRVWHGVRKEMYDFDDRGGRHVALRPEGTASVVRAFVEHHPLTPWKVWYATPCFRYERPQAGRLRQHHQVGVEVLGPHDPDVDVEVIALGSEFLTVLGLGRDRPAAQLDGKYRPTGSGLRRGGAACPWPPERRGDLAPDDP